MALLETPSGTPRPNDHLPLTRAVFALVAILYPCGYFTFTRFIPHTRDYLFGRVVISALFAAGFALTYVRSLRPFAYRYMTLAVCALGIHYVSLLKANEFHRAYIVGSFVIFTTVNAAFSTRGSALLFVFCYLTAISLALRSAPKDILSGVILGGFTLVGIVQLVLTEFRVRTARRIHEFFLERERANERLAATSALSSLGEMAGGIAHEINNPLTIILMRTQQLERWLRETPSTDFEKPLEMVNSLTSTANRIERIVRGMRSLSRDGSADPMSAVKVSQFIDDVLSICSEKFEHRGVELSVDVQADAKAFCRPTQISQVLLNLLNNALDAVETAPTKRVFLTAKHVVTGIEIRVVDSGPGVDPRVQDKLFLPFVTTKAPGRGTGLGLSISRRIIEDHGGTLVLDRKSAETTFVIRIAANGK